MHVVAQTDVEAFPPVRQPWANVIWNKSAKRLKFSYFHKIQYMPHSACGLVVGPGDVFAKFPSSSNALAECH